MTGAVTRLRRSHLGTPGWTRVRTGRGFRYTDAEGNVLHDPAVIERIEALVIPPAWRDVWICPWPNGHIQATGTDAAGRLQYRYHDAWRRQRDQAKHERILLVAQRLPQARERIAGDLDLPGMPRERALATAARLLDLGFFRIGSDSYAEEHGSYGLTTLLRAHVTLRRSPPAAVFDFIAKSGQHQVKTIIDPAALAAISLMRRRRSGPDELLAFRTGSEWHRIDAHDVNAYLTHIFGMGDDPCPVSAKDFRTWHGTTFMAVALAVSESPPRTPSARRRMLARSYREVAHYLGNTPAVCRSSYVDPRLVERWERGHTIRPCLTELGAGTEFGELATHGVVEEAVRDLLAEA